MSGRERVCVWNCNKLNLESTLFSLSSPLPLPPPIFSPADCEYALPFEGATKEEEEVEEEEEEEEEEKEKEVEEEGG